MGLATIEICRCPAKTTSNFLTASAIAPHQIHAQHTGDFEKDLTDDLTGLEPKSLAALVDWRRFYMEHKVGNDKPYVICGKLSRVAQS